MNEDATKIAELGLTPQQVVLSFATTGAWGRGAQKWRKDFIKAFNRTHELGGEGRSSRRAPVGPRQRVPDILSGLTDYPGEILIRVELGLSNETAVSC